jgi:hypothetical protein
VIGPGEAAPNAEVWLAPRQPVRLHELAAPGEAILFLFYLFDWSST